MVVVTSSISLSPTRQAHQLKKGITVKNHGFDRKAKVPQIEGTHAKLCGQCQAWFAAEGKQRRCDRCVPRAELTKRTQARHYAQIELDAQRGSQSRVGTSGPAHTTTRKRRNSRESGQVTGTRSDGGALCRQLAEELALEVDLAKAKGKRGRPAGELHPLSRAEIIAHTRRNVALGLQGRSDLDRLVSR